MKKAILAALLCLLAAEAQAMTGPELTKLNEGWSPTPYRCTAGAVTIGWGFNCDALGLDCSRDKTLSKRDAEAIFRDEYAAAWDRARRYAGTAWEDLPQHRKAVLTDLAYNLGGRLWSFKRMRAALQAGDNAGTLRELKASKWWHQVKSRGPRLVKYWNSNI